MKVLFYLSKMKYLELTTARLQLRPLQDEDAKDILFLRSDAIVNKFVKRQKTETISDAVNFIKRIQKSVSNKEVCYWSICLKNNPRLTGTICLWNFSEDLKTAEIGFDLHPDYHGKGIMSEALNAVLEFGFNELELKLIEAYTQEDNLASVNLLKKKSFSLIEDRVDEDNPKNAIFVLEKKHFRTL